MKKALSLVLAMAMLLTLMPISAWSVSAAEPISQTINNITLHVDAPVAERTADFDAQVSAYPAASVRVYTDQKGDFSLTRGVSWFDTTTEKYLKEGDSFVSGHGYKLTVYVISSNPFYYVLADSLRATVDGNAATVTKNGTYTAWVTYDYGVCAEPPSDVTEVTVGGMLLPVDGEYPVFAVAIDEERLTRDVWTGTAFINNVAWYETDSYSILGENDTFRAGKQYTMMVKLGAKGIYRFATENGKSAVKASFLGIEAQNVTHEDNVDPEQVLTLKWTFTCAEASAVGGGAGVIDLRIDAPVGGKRRSYAPTLYGNAVISSITNSSTCFYDGVRWSNLGRALAYSENAVFSAKAVYSVTVAVSAETIMQDDKRLRYYIAPDGSILPHVRATVNGYPARVEAVEVVDAAQRVWVTFDFPACNDTTRTIDSVDVRDVEHPIVGKIPDFTATVTYGYREAVPDSVALSNVRWVNRSTFEVMNETDTFEEGVPYMLVLSVGADILTEFFTGSDGSYQGDARVCGTDKIATDLDLYNSDKNLLIGAEFIPLASRPEPIRQIDIIGAVKPSVGALPVLSASLSREQMPYAEITGVTWYEDNSPMEQGTPFRAGHSYMAAFKLEVLSPYAFRVTSADDVAINVTVNGDNTYYTYEVGATGYVLRGNSESATVNWYFGVLSSEASGAATDYVEVSALMRPAPGQTPDVDVSVDSAYTQFGGVSWFELDDDGNRVMELTYLDRFRKNTRYRAEVRLLASAGRTIDLDRRGAVLNNEMAHYYYLSDDAVTVYAEYDTAHCIDTVELADVQYPIPGKTPDTDAVVRNLGATAGAVQWYSETNPDTAVAGWTALDGRFKTDRRHQAYVALTTEDGYWFATDSEGTLAVEAYIDGVAVDFAYTTDSYLTDGTCDALELVRTFERAWTVSGVFVDGLWLTDGQYLDSAHLGVQTAQTVDKSAGYAYYEDGVLTFYDFDWTMRGDYNAIDLYRPLTIRVEGVSSMTSTSIGISTNAALTLEGNGELELCTNGEGIFAMDAVTVNSGTYTVTDSKYDGLWLYDSLVINGGTLSVYGPQCGICGEDYPPVTVNGGTLIAAAEIDCAINWCDVRIGSGATVSVAPYGGSELSLWDGGTAWNEFRMVQIAFEDDALLGDLNLDGKVNTMDALLLYGGVNGQRSLTAEQKAVADVTGDGNINTMDALQLYRRAAGL